MNEEGQQADWKLIQTLLTCPMGQETQILQANQDLVDTELVLLMEIAADKIAEKGNHKAANLLRQLAEELAKMLGMASPKPNYEKYFQFLMNVLQTVSDDPRSQSVYPLLQANLDKLDNYFIAVLRAWAKIKLSKVEPSQAEGIASDIVNFSNLIQQFPLGNKAANIEISLVGYELSLTVFTRDSHSESWAGTQNNLGNAYRNRIKGDRAENIENALAAYQRALSVRTSSAFPTDWAHTQNNLGVAYRDRIKGDRAKNIENALAAYQRALSVRTSSAFPTDWAMPTETESKETGQKISKTPWQPTNGLCRFALHPLSLRTGQ